MATVTALVHVDARDAVEDLEIATACMCLGLIGVAMLWQVVGVHWLHLRCDTRRLSEMVEPAWQAAINAPAVTP